MELLLAQWHRPLHPQLGFCQNERPIQSESKHFKITIYLVFYYRKYLIGWNLLKKH